ncbi:MAG: ribbon-helix-helix domain-containing protein [Lacipirellulaceae bacterium]
MIELTPEQQAFVEHQVEIGAFGAPAQVVQAGLELLREAADRREHAETIASIERGRADFAAGRVLPLDEAFERIRRSLGLPERAATR